LVIVPYNTDIERIIAVIKADTNVFDSGKTVGKLRSVQYGNPAEMKKNSPDENNMPYCYVTTGDSLQKTSYPFGVSVPTNLSQITVPYKIVVVADAKDKQVNAEKLLYNLLTNLRTTLGADPTFKKPVSNDDPIFTRSIINESIWETKTKGKLFQIVEFTLIATIGTELTITIPGFGDLVILSDTGDDGRNNTSIHNDEGFTKRSKGAFEGVRFFEYEYTTTIFDALETLIIADNALALILKYASGNKTYTSKLEHQRITKRFDGIRTVFLQVNRETV